MGFGIREPEATQGKHVPGTATIFDKTGDAGVDNSITLDLKHAKGRKSDIILVPQPSDSVNDPLVSTLLGLSWRPYSPSADWLTVNCYRTGQDGRKI